MREIFCSKSIRLSNTFCRFALENKSCLLVRFQINKIHRLIRVLASNLTLIGEAKKWRALFYTYGS